MDSVIQFYNFNNENFNNISANVSKYQKKELKFRKMIS